MKSKFLALCFSALLCSCSFNTKPKEVPAFLGDIKCDAQLEQCLANGTVVADFEDNSYKLPSVQFNGCMFSSTAVKFAEDKTIAEIKLKYNHLFGGGYGGDSSQDIYNKMIQYCCQQYGEMKTEKIDSYKNEKKRDGIRNTWSTDELNVTLEAYKLTVVRKEKINLPVDFDAMMWEGNYVEFVVAKK